MISVKNLYMDYGTTVAVSNLTFHVPKGEVVGLLGPNGAGKTTTMRILTTYISPTSGDVSIGGYNVRTSCIPVRKMIGYLPEIPPLYMDMSVCGYLSFIADARGISGNLKAKRTNWVINACKIQDVYRKNILELSRGYRQRLGLAQALIHDPDILILDEPTAGLDPLQIIDIRNLIKSLSGEKTIIFSTHILQEVAAVSERVIIISEGKIIADGSKDKLKRDAMKNNRYILIVKADKEAVSKGLSSINAIKDYNFVDRDKDGMARFEILSDFTQPVWSDIDKLVKSEGWILKSFSEEPFTFEETFISLIKKSKRGNNR